MPSALAIYFVLDALRLRRLIRLLEQPDITATSDGHIYVFALRERTLVGWLRVTPAGLVRAAPRTLPKATVRRD